MKHFIFICMIALTLRSHAAILSGGSTLVEGVMAPNQLIVTGEPARSLYEQLNVSATKDHDYIENVLKKSARQMSCSLAVDSKEYSCKILISVDGIVKQP